MSKYDENKQLRCSFCGKPQSQVTRLVAGIHLRRMYTGLPRHHKRRDAE